MSDNSNTGGLVKYKLPKIFEKAAKEYHPYIFLSGGRGSGKSYFAAFFFIVKALSEKCRIWCAREIQNTMKDSTHYLICELIQTLGVGALFTITDTSITCKTTGSDFLFQGLRDQDAEKVKSKQSVKYVWVEEAQSITQNSLDILIPTIIRNDGFQFVFTYNPKYDDDPVHKMATSKREEVLHIHSTYTDNPYVSESLIKEAEYCKIADPAKYNHIWLGLCTGHGGIIYTMYDEKWHVEDIDLCDDEFRTANHFMAMDPHPQHYPAITWWALTKYNVLWCYNEYPYQGGPFGNRPYDEVRLEALPNDWNINKIATIINAFDGTEFGVKNIRRVIDPRYVSSADKGDSLKATVSLIQLYAQAGIKGFEIPNHQNIDVMRERVKEYLGCFNKTADRSMLNRPRILVSSWCKNMRRALERHHMDEKDRYEDQTHKDMIDTLRYLLSIIGGNIEWKSEAKDDKKLIEEVNCFNLGTMLQSSSVMAAR